MTIPVNIRLQTEIVPLNGSDDGYADNTELNFKGELRRIDNGYVLQYKSQLTENTIAVFDKIITVNRTGQISSQLVFEVGRSYFGTFSDGVNTIQMSTFTKKLESKLTDEGGCFMIDYSIAYSGTMFERNRVTYTVIPTDGNVAS